MLVRAVEPVDRFEGLVGLLEQMAGERAVGLLPIPRALAAQGAHELGEAHELGRDRRMQRRDPERGQVVGRERAVELGPVDLEDPLVGQAEVVEHDDRDRSAASSTASLMSESTAGVSHCATSERASFAGGVDGEALAVDEPHARGERVDAESRPHEVEERQRGHDLDLDASVGAQQLDRPLGDERRARHRVEHLTRAVAAVDELVDDARVDRVERRLLLVDVVEAAWQPARRPRTGAASVRTNAIVDRARSRRAPLVTSSGPAGPSPTTTTRGWVTLLSAGRAAVAGAEPSIPPRSVGTTALIDSFHIP